MNQNSGSYENNRNQKKERVPLLGTTRLCGEGWKTCYDKQRCRRKGRGKILKLYKEKNKRWKQIDEEPRYLGYREI